eukprot:1332908-Rhodomonas_salina.1
MRTSGMFSRRGWAVDGVVSEPQISALVLFTAALLHANHNKYYWKNEVAVRDSQLRTLQEVCRSSRSLPPPTCHVVY